MRPHDENGMSVETLLLEQRPEPSSEFAAELDALAERRFAKPSEDRPARRRFQLRYALGAASVVVVVAVSVAASGVLQGEKRSDEKGLGGLRAVTPQSSEAGPDFDEALAGKRRVARTADLSLSTTPEDVPEVADGVIEVTHRYRGFVLDSAVSSGDVEDASARFRIKLPARNLQPALDDLSELGHVTELTNRTKDITTLHAVVKQRIEELTNRRELLLSRLDRAETPQRARRVRADLRQVNRQLEGPRDVLDRTTERARFAPVQVTVDGESEPDTGWTIGDALDDAVRVLEVAVAVTLIALAGAVPVAIVAALLWLAARAWVRRRREAALDERPEAAR